MKIRFEKKKEKGAAASVPDAEYGRMDFALALGAVRDSVRSRRGFALLIVLGFGLVIGIFSIAMIQQSIVTARINTNKIDSSKAQYAAQGGIEWAQYKLKNFAPGDASQGTITVALDSRPVNVNWKIETQSSERGGLWYAPMPGTGDAGEDCRVWEDYAVPASFEDDHSCNWNKIKVGETVNIPLWYYDAADLDKIVNPWESGLSRVDLRLRAPCKNGSDEEDCGGAERYKFGVANGKTDVSDLIVYWEMTAVDTANRLKSYLLQTNTEAQQIAPYSRLPKNSEIHEYLIDQAYQPAGNYIVLDIGKWGVREDNVTSKKISTFFTPIPLPPYQPSQPSLKLLVAHSLQTITGEEIPYLEYQLVTDKKVSSSKQILRATSSYKNVEREITLTKDQEGPIGGFVIQN